MKNYASTHHLVKVACVLSAISIFLLIDQLFWNGFSSFSHTVELEDLHSSLVNLAENFETIDNAVVSNISHRLNEMIAYGNLVDSNFLALLSFLNLAILLIIGTVILSLPHSAKNQNSKNKIFNLNCDNSHSIQDQAFARAIDDLKKSAKDLHEAINSETKIQPVGDVRRFSGE